MKISYFLTLDEVFDEERSRVKNDKAPANLSILRHCAFNLLNKVKKSFFKDYTLRSMSYLKDTTHADDAIMVEKPWLC